MMPSDVVTAHAEYSVCPTKYRLSNTLTGLAYHVSRAGAPGRRGVGGRARARRGRRRRRAEAGGDAGVIRCRRRPSPRRHARRPCPGTTARAAIANASDDREEHARQVSHCASSPSLRTVFQLRAVPRVPSAFSIICDGQLRAALAVRINEVGLLALGAHDLAALDRRLQRLHLRRASAHRAGTSSPGGPVVLRLGRKGIGGDDRLPLLRRSHEVVGRDAEMLRGRGLEQSLELFARADAALETRRCRSLTASSAPRDRSSRTSRAGRHRDPVVRAEIDRAQHGDVGRHDGFRARKTSRPQSSRSPAAFSPAISNASSQVARGNRPSMCRSWTARTSPFASRNRNA